MNKTIIININGIVFHIEEDAYEILKNYMTDVKRHFATSADSLEITTDIENRVAEMFSELLQHENKQVIVEQDVNTVVEQMGTVADFERAENDIDAESNPFIYKAESRRLFRDPDDHLIAGVCAGVANYFDVDPVWIRLAFALFTPIAGTGFLLYLILWIVVPKAVTRADRMSMKGEKQNLQGFKMNFEAELGSVKQNLSNFGNEARPLVYKTRDFVTDFFHHLGVFLNGAGKLLVKLLGIFILLACFGLIIFFVVAFVALLGFGYFAPFNDLPIDLLRHNHATYIYIAAFLVIIIPLLAIILLTLRGIFNTGTLSWASGSSALIVWLCALGVFIFYCVQIAINFRSSASFSATINIKPVTGTTYYLKLNDLKYLTHDDSTRLNIKNLAANVKITENTNDFDGFDYSRHRNVHLYIEKSDVNQPVLVESFKAMGSDYDQALLNASNITYRFTQQDTILNFDYRLYSRRNALWHGEELDITLKVPLNSKLVIDEALNDMLDGSGNMSIYDCKNANYHDKASSALFVMTDNGLQCKIDSASLKKASIIKDSLKKDSANAGE